MRNFSKALRRAFNMLMDDAEATARVVESTFRGGDEVNDEDLDREIRSLFYALEREDLLGIRRTEYNFEGQVHRAYFWHLKSLDKLVADDDELEQSLSREEREALKLYRSMPAESWTRVAPRKA